MSDPNQPIDQATINWQQALATLIAVPIVACANVDGTYLSRRHEGPRPPEPRQDRARPVVGNS